ncbi:MAG: chemotaxis protein CheD [Candidatus Krumholzibacteria bacterium]|jgi:chemotaxis protein CheD|nr:chemotaxis protein CheD [Candidatus Krumholzibacteria bacterium]MDY0110300.1 chemotaxis protein CheD [Candidatus Krumholzibacteria bacterium]
MLLQRRQASPGVKMVTVDISDMKVSESPQDILVTYSLGSCIGLALYDRVAKVGGLIHCMLPLAKIDPGKAALRPFMFVDAGVSKLLAALFDLGAQRRNLVAKLAGAGSPLGKEETFRIGQRNYTIMRKLLWKNSILIDAEDIGGAKARTMYLYMADGLVTVKSEGKEVPL